MPMQFTRAFWLVGTICLVPYLVAAQEGFPLDGTWRGEWGNSDTESNHVVIVMKWDGDTVTGRINPGPNSIDFANAWLEPADWGVHIEAISPDGEPIRVDGTLTDVGSYNRRVTGTWQVGETVYEFTITRE